MMYTVIMLFIVISKIETGQIMWDLKEKPAVFGKDVQLVCSLPHDTSCCRKYNRKWNVGWKYTLTIMNDKSLNETKYSEKLNETSDTSILTIKTFSVDDVNIPYECEYGFMKYRATLMLKEDEYEFHPKEQLPVKPTVKNNKITLNVTFHLVYPAPDCSAMIGVNNISSDLIVSSTSYDMLYMSTITLDYMTSPTECKQSLIVTCRVGETLLTVTDFIPCSSKGTPHLLIVGIVIAVIITVSLLFLILIVINKRRKRNDRTEHTEDNVTFLRQEGSK